MKTQTLDRQVAAECQSLKSTGRLSGRARRAGADSGAGPRNSEVQPVPAARGAGGAPVSDQDTSPESPRLHDQC